MTVVDRREEKPVNSSAKTILCVLLSVFLFGWGAASVVLFVYRLPTLTAGGIVSAALGLLLAAAGILGVLHRCRSAARVIGILLLLTGAGFFLFTLVAHLFVPAVSVSWGNLLTVFLAACYLSLL